VAQIVNSSGKIFVLDTNILLHSPNAIYGFGDNTVVLTATTIEELDAKKKDGGSGEIRYNARESARILDGLRTKGDLIKGVPLENGGKLKIELDGIKDENLPQDYSLKRPDNRIISACVSLKQESESPVILVTNDAFMRIKASVCDIQVEEYKNDHVVSDEFYTGRIVLDVSPNVINQIYTTKKMSVEDIYISDDQEFEWIENEFVTLKAGTQSVLCVYKKGNLHVVKNLTNVFGVKPRNAAQTYFLSALLAPADEVPIVIGIGPAGCAKTFLSLAAGLDQTYDSKSNRQYDKILITRSNVMADADFGYLPGELEEKMLPLLAPFFDNLESLLRGSSGEDSSQIRMQMEDMLETKVIDICPLAYMRGRSITNSYLIVDEAQNATKSQIRDIITRAGKGTKIILLGDPEQIDNHLLDRWNNGLVFAAEKMKGSPLCAQLTFTDNESVRSELATEAIKRLDL
jgi:PhoH-like ATPase